VKGVPIEWCWNSKITKEMSFKDWLEIELERLEDEESMEKHSGTCQRLETCWNQELSDKDW